MQCCIPHFTMVLTGAKDNDSMVLRYLDGSPDREKECRPLLYKLPYTLPDRKFDGIRRLQAKLIFQPFRDSCEKSRRMAVDLSEWIGHEDEEFLLVFMKYLHDINRDPTLFFYIREILVTVGEADHRQVRRLYRLCTRFLINGKIREDNLFAQPDRLVDWIRQECPSLDRVTAQVLADMFTRGDHRESMAELRTVLEDFAGRFPQDQTITINALTSPVLKGSALETLFPEELENCQQNLHRSRRSGAREGGCEQ